jgi:type II secretory pathway pseudopilin PulG
VLKRLRMRLRADGGFGLIELLIAITVLNVAILSIVAAYTSGSFAIKRASQASTASVLADQQMELYRAQTYDNIALDSNTLSTVPDTYKCDSALGTGTCPYSTSSEVTVTCSGSPLPDKCNPWRQTTGPDHHKYYVATYILNDHPTGSARTVRTVTVAVRDGLNTSKIWARETSTFDCSTGLPLPANTYCPTT